MYSFAVVKPGLRKELSSACIDDGKCDAALAIPFFVQERDTFDRQMVRRSIDTYVLLKNISEKISEKEH